MTTVQRHQAHSTEHYHVGFSAAEARSIATSAALHPANCSTIAGDGITLIRGADSNDRATFIALRQNVTILSLLTQAGAGMFICGEKLIFGQLAVHLPGDRFHEASRAGTPWIRIVLAPGTLLAEAAGRSATLPTGQFPLRRVTAPPGAMQTLLAAIETAFANGILHPQETVTHALASCFRGPLQTRPPAAARRRQSVMLRFQDYMSFWSEQPVHISDFCKALDVPARTLEDYCQTQCGVSPYKLLRLFRLQLVHAALCAATSSTDSVTSASRRYGFLDLGRFASTYRAAFNELPSQTLAKAPIAARTDARAAE